MYPGSRRDKIKEETHAIIRRSVRAVSLQYLLAYARGRKTVIW